MFSVGIQIIFTFTLVRGRSSIIPFCVIEVVVFFLMGGGVEVYFCFYVSIELG